MFISFAKITGMGEGCLLSWGEALLGISAGYDQNKKFKDQSSGSSWQHENFGHQNVYVFNNLKTTLGFLDDLVSGFR